jgi:hypothetical protein
LPLGNQQLDPLAAGVDGVVTLILVVLQRRVIPDLVAQLAERISIAQRFEELLGTV